ncbi:molybdopterin-synthase adenylyltransferase MoeB [Alcanivorax sp. 1008]|uniref:HesA/MoeB/ThiF family protein n=1 Tax=Alcanivorax sp. 1008 TaxID=2816853 RepID=UPI001DBB3870|nr:molybdopterin-synthase adenylyltransferase MoeB [Alcanivorax sp. 1008]MCC1497346.1 molybdopterin-synthase adenylyltransferase MoeB [Alcanivorax sp. 1008]
MLSDDELLRYSRQILLPEIDLAGQEKLRAASVLIVGAGGLGTPASLYLAGAGVGKLLLVDDDRVEQSNLHRQIAFRQNDVGNGKAVALAAQLLALNPGVDVVPLGQRADAALLADYLPEVDVVLDCSDNFATRSMINRACVESRKPLVSGAAIQLAGQLVVFDLRDHGSPCYHCVYGDGVERNTLCSESGILGPVVGIVGAAQALETIKLICGLPLSGRLHLFDGACFEWRSLGIKQDRNCSVCSLRGR